MQVIVERLAAEYAGRMTWTRERAEAEHAALTDAERALVGTVRDLHMAVGLGLRDIMNAAINARSKPEQPATVPDRVIILNALAHMLEVADALYPHAKTAPLGARVLYETWSDAARKILKREVAR